MAHSQTHTSLKVKCTMDEPIELLMDKLSSKSSELYVFWVTVRLRSKITTKCTTTTTKKSTKTTNSRKNSTIFAGTTTKRYNKRPNIFKSTKKTPI